MKIIKPNSPSQYYSPDYPSVFLAGSIEMGSAIDWQSLIVSRYFKDNNHVAFLNPRRDDWDSSCSQDESNIEFNKQVNWELNNLDKCSIIFMYFDPSTKSPISLLELGKYADSGKMIVCCPKGFWRKGNVDIVCTRHNIPLYDDFEKAIGALYTKINSKII